MDNELHTTLSEITSLAHEHGWSRVTALMNNLYSRSTSVAQALVSAPDDVDITAFLDWIEEVVPKVKVGKISLQQLSVDPLPAVVTEKVVAVFECGRLLESEAVVTIISTLLSRPFHSYAIVMSKAERVETEDDLDLIERGIQRLFLSNLVSTWNKQNLLERGVYLWSDTLPVDWLQSRVQRDKDALAAWLDTPLPLGSALADQLASYRALCAIDLAENELNQEELARVRTSNSIDQWQCIYNAGQSISDLRRQLMRRVDAGAESVEQTIHTLLRTLQEDLLAGLDLAVLQQPGVTSLSKEQFHQALTDYIARGARGWQRKSNELLASTAANVLNDVEIFVQGVDWPLINQLASKYGKTAAYPDVLIESLHQDTGVVPSMNLEEDEQDWRPDVEDDVLTSVLGMVAGGGVTSAVALLLFGPIGAVTGGILGLIGMGVFAQRRRSSQKISMYRQYAQETIQRVIRGINLHVQEQMQEDQQALRRILGTELSVLETMLDQALHEERQIAGTGAGVAAVRAWLQKCRHKLTAQANE